ncbi:hypothetical protein BpHYR1_017295 [Brachionus plicatilis]|uniref:Uncharacterized protein n=1 Tax=Brachionus plicatilis TaxID=10195 RepID=A0A3M7R4H8_BRAPC|nr:hypothetical protein BpHYR1_017295 [Brachionus plicatilis]
MECFCNLLHIIKILIYGMIANWMNKSKEHCNRYFRKKEEITQWSWLDSIYLNWKPSLYSSTSLTTSGTEWLNPALAYLSLNSKSQLETFLRMNLNKEKNNPRLILSRICKDYLIVKDVEMEVLKYLLHLFVLIMFYLE